MRYHHGSRSKPSYPHEGKNEITMWENSLLPKACQWLGIASLSDLVLLSQDLCVTVASSDSWLSQGSFPSWPLKQLWLQT